MLSKVSISNDGRPAFLFSSYISLVLNKSTSGICCCHENLYTVSQQAWGQALSQRASRLTALKQFRKHFFTKRVVKQQNTFPRQVGGRCPMPVSFKRHMDNALNYVL